MSGSLEEEEASCWTESETRFLVGKPNLGERRGEAGGLGVVRLSTAICSNEIGQFPRMFPKKLHTIQVKIRNSSNQLFTRYSKQRVQIEAVRPLFVQ